MWNVARLTLLRQRQLFTWLSETSARIIAMSDHSLFRRVQQGAFCDRRLVVGPPAATIAAPIPELVAELALGRGTDDR